MDAVKFEITDNRIEERNKTPIVICQKLLSLIKTENNSMSVLTTIDEVLNGLKFYIFEKNLFDPNRMLVTCEDDELGKVFGVTEFTISDVKKLAGKFMFPVSCATHKGCMSAEVTPSICVSENTSKRKTEESLEGIPIAKKKYLTCSESCAQCTHKEVCTEFSKDSYLYPTSSRKENTSPMILHIPSSPVRFESDSCESAQGYETSVVKNTSDESVIYCEGENSEEDPCLTFPEGSILTVAETFELEFEPNSDSDSMVNSEFSDTDSSDSEDALHSIITFVCKTDSDQEYLADMSSDENDSGFDAEISVKDRWKCDTCDSLNDPPSRFCLKCWDTRSGWLACEKRPYGTPVNRKPKKKGSKQKKLPCTDSSQFSKEESLSSNKNSQSFDLPSTSQESIAPSFEDGEKHTKLKHDSDKNNSDAKVCILCCSKPVDSSIIHGKFAHSFSCYKCAKKLQNLKKRCPICRRTIEKVVYQISIL